MPAVPGVAFPGAALPGIALLVAALVVGAFASTPVQARHRGHHEAAEATAGPAVALAALPDEARNTYRAIRAGGPFAFEKDGIAFGNRERALPARPRGYYREYTVPTPGAHDRGARRIVCGGAQPAQPDACFYTGDHYSTFQQIEP